MSVNQLSNTIIIYSTLALPAHSVFKGKGTTNSTAWYKEIHCCCLKRNSLPDWELGFRVSVQEFRICCCMTREEASTPCCASHVSCFWSIFNVWGRLARSLCLSTAMWFLNARNDVCFILLSALYTIFSLLMPLILVIFQKEHKHVFNFAWRNWNVKGIN